ncbi:patatin family protein [Vibrio alginolyticus]|uniref:patatin-like phospholipase family protein n=1 Tax=Vibrio alginolyticus TaxID=663 RepID=UPI001BD3606A|nr:patatin family protein [Vibrio alginolyticus]MBT0028729.1 patatin family protein [Vibrio alginolyticus]
MEKVGSRALIVEGGAMRGVFSCGILDHFLASEFSPFDSFWGVSAGASNLAAYLAKMPGRNLKIYLDYSLRKEFISPSQLLRGGDMMNLDWMWNVTLEELGIDKSVLKADSRPFFLGVTRQDNGQAEYHLPDVDDLAETMKASSALPVLYRNGVSLNGIQYVDGGVSDALPVAEAIKRGAKKIMVLRSQPASYQKPRGRFSALTRKMLKETPGLIEPMLTREVRYNQTLALINNPPPGIEIIQVCPPETFKLKRLSRSPAPLRHAYELGIEARKEAIIRWSQK